ncbi:MAG: S49 family peptidase [Arenicella sp.]|nr:S49 family peptidase [Arenicella sp.]
MLGRNKNTAALPGSHSAPVTSSEVMERLAEDYMKDRKWRRVFKFILLGLFLLYIVSAIFLASGGAGVSTSQPHTALVELNGVISTAQGDVSADKLNASLKRAFEAKMSKGIVLRINSPGGSPVQSDLINAEIGRLRGLYPGKPLHVVVSDVCASGGYYIAAAADQIYANPSSIVGSIGVRMDGFGFVGAMDKLGVERRSLTAGENKAILDPFLPVKESQQAHAKEMLAIVHQQFINRVKAGRGERLSDSPEIFSGLFWSGEQAKELGLIDEFGSLDYVAREVIGQEAIVDYSYKPDLLTQFAQDLGISIGAKVVSAFGGQLKLN